MKVISANLNGIRSATQKGFFDWLAAECADIVCIQELKAQQTDLPAHILAPNDWHGVFSCADKKGYSGVAIYSRQAPDAVRIGFGSEEFDAEGRLIAADFGTLTVVSLYLPSGSSSPERQAAKFRCLAALRPVLQQWLASHRTFLLCGDWNIAHTSLDLKNWRANQKNSGFLPEERAWLSGVLHEGWVDVYRHLHPQATEEGYTWWSNRGQAWANNVGWRIDYQLATPALAASARRAWVYKSQRFSDHAPLLMEYEGSW